MSKVYLISKEVIVSSTILMAASLVTDTTAYEQGIEWEFEVSNESYLLTGLNEDEFPSWTLIDLELYAEVAKTFNNGYTLFAGAKEGVGYDRAEREVELEEYYVGLEFNGYRFGYGAKEYATEEFDLSLEIGLGRQTDFEQIEDRGQQVLFLQIEQDHYELGFSTDFSKNSASFDAFVSSKIGDRFTLRMAYQRFRAGSEEDYINTAGLTLLTQVGKWELINSISNNELTTSVDIGVHREFENGNKFALSCGVENPKNDHNDQNTICFTNFVYKVSDYMFLNTELGI